MYICAFKLICFPRHFHSFTFIGIFLSFNPFRVIRIFTIDILLSLEGTMKLPLPCQMGKIYVKVVIGCFVFAKYFELLCTFDL